MNFVDRNTQT